MPHRAIVPVGLEAAVANLKLSPGVVSGQHVFLTGMTGGNPDGTMPGNIEDQARAAFQKIGRVLAEVDLGFSAIVEMTTYHVGLRDHFDRFNIVRTEFLSEPFPAWTAVEVAGLRREGAVVEIRVIAALPTA
jgi:enamine deaminase RidA (YjgF/YER057c/UK114 family)